MDRWEALARRYCAFAGRDPDETYDGYTGWQHALDDIEAAVAALDTFELGVRERFENPVPQEPSGDLESNVIRFPGHAA